MFSDKVFSCCQSCMGITGGKWKRCLLHFGRTVWTQIHKSNLLKPKVILHLRQPHRLELSISRKWVLKQWSTESANFLLPASNKAVEDTGPWAPPPGRSSVSSVRRVPFVLYQQSVIIIIRFPRDLITLRLCIFWRAILTTLFLSYIFTVYEVDQRANG